VKAVLNMLRDAGSDADILLEQSMGRNGTEDETEREEEAWSGRASSMHIRSSDIPLGAKILKTL